MAQESCAIILPQFIAVCVIALTQEIITYKILYDMISNYGVDSINFTYNTRHTDMTGL